VLSHGLSYHLEIALRVDISARSIPCCQVLRSHYDSILSIPIPYNLHPITWIASVLVCMTRIIIIHNVHCQTRRLLGTMRHPRYADAQAVETPHMGGRTLTS
jgi:hypothetical protein